jgi:enamine deaminase RidA (YjgF/YER057c/UK114 family)
MKQRTVSAPTAPSAAGGYAQAVEVSGATRVLYISGQVPLDAAGRCPPTFRQQCELVWQNLEPQLLAADMTLDHLVKVTTFLSDRRFGAENSAIRQEILKHRSPALTVIIASIYDEEWLLEIEGVAVA